MSRIASDELLSAALGYAAAGMHVIPLHGVDGGCCTCLNPACSSPGKHPRTQTGFKEATCDADRIQAWWAQWPAANVGIATGASGLVVLDLDVKNGQDGVAVFELWEDQHGPAPTPWIVRTGGGGIHRVYHAPSSCCVRSRTGVAAGVDVRATDGYIVAPPSWHISGKRYELLDYAIDDAVVFDVPEPPPWLLDMVQQTCLTSNGAPRANGHTNGVVPRPDWAALLRGVPEGERNSTAARIAGHLLAHGHDEAEIFEQMRGFAAGCQPPMDSAELRKTIGNVARCDRRNHSDPHDASGAAQNGVANGADHAGSTTNPAPRKAIGPADVLLRWASDGALVHEPTGIAKLDEMTGGGPVLGTRVYVVGAPDAGKTALLVQIADEYLRRGIAVGLLAVDEEPGDITQRLLQRRDWSRRQCERRDPADLEAMARQVADLPLRLYDATWPIEAAGEDLAAFAREIGTRAMLGVDSIQTVRCALEDEKGSRYEAVTARVQALRAVAEEHRLIAIATSEMSRAAYRSADPTQRIDELASAKESGAVEYSARVLLALRSVEGESDLVELRVRKNKLGPIHRSDESGIPLRIDRGRQTLIEATDYAPPTMDDHESSRAAKRDRQTIEDAGRIAVALALQPGMPARRCEDTVSAATPGRMGHTRFGAARATLGSGLIERPGPRTQVLLYLDGSMTPAAVIEAVPIERRPFVVAARPPAEEPASKKASEATSCPEPPPGAPSRPGAGEAPPTREVPPAPIGGGAPRAVRVSTTTSPRRQNGGSSSRGTRARTKDGPQ